MECQGTTTSFFIITYENKSSLSFYKVDIVRLDWSVAAERDGQRLKPEFEEWRAGQQVEVAPLRCRERGVHVELGIAVLAPARHAAQEQLKNNGSAMAKGCAGRFV